MKVIEALNQTSQPIISLEIVPPERGADISDIYHSIESLMRFGPKFVNVTNHQLSNLTTAGGSPELNKRPGTVGVSMAIKNRFGVESVPHFIGCGMNKFLFEDTLIDLKYLGLENVFIIRGDAAAEHPPMKHTGCFAHASDMIRQAAEMNRGIYLSSAGENARTSFCIGAAGYPEKHFEAPSLEQDILWLKRKVDEGADYVITQMFFDAAYYKNFVERARAEGISVPIIPGIKPIVSRRALSVIPQTFYVTLPAALRNALETARTPKEEFDAGTKYMAKLVRQLIDFGVPSIHIFTMSRGKSTYALLKRVFG
ncbi:MAG: methylenetetrahydrofolate reductase [Patescibacteria group bacterium]